jgi:hypothetical protein
MKELDAPIEEGAPLKNPQGRRKQNAAHHLPRREVYFCPKRCGGNI